MGIRQQKRPDAPRPEVRKTDYGASFIKAATEKPLEHEVVTLEEQKEREAAADTAEADGDAHAPAQETSVEEKEVSPNESKPAVKPKKKGGRPKKTRK